MSTGILARSFIFSVFLFTSAVFTSGCASYFKRKECEKINWYEHGYNIAMQGSRPSRDQTVADCRKVEADISDSQLDRGFKEGMSNYCKPDVAFQTGKKGEPLNLDLCDNSQANNLTLRHKEGVKAFCAPDNGFPVGATGRKYNGICPQNMEKDFLKEFNRGRKKFLAGSISENESKIRDYDSKVLDAERRKSTTALRLATLPPARTVVTNGVSQTVDDYSGERSNLRSQLTQADQDVRHYRSEQEKLKNQIYDFQKELAALE